MGVQPRYGKTWANGQSLRTCIDACPRWHVYMHPRGKIKLHHKIATLPKKEFARWLAKYPKKGG